MNSSLCSTPQRSSDLSLLTTLCRHRSMRMEIMRAQFLAFSDGRGTVFGDQWKREGLARNYPKDFRRFSATASGAIRTGSASRWAYRAVVWTCVWPRSLPIMGRP